MKKSTNQFRRCPNCPHHNTREQKCCCLRNSATRKARPMTSRNKRQPSTVDQSVINTTLPTIVAEFSALRTQNNQLKRQLLNVSTFIRDENCPPNTSNNDTALNEKLFLSNKNLKEALLEIDNLSKANKQLCERNARLTEQSQGLKIQLRQVEDYLDKYKKKFKKMAKDSSGSISKQQFDNMRQYNSELQEQVAALREQIRCLRFQNRNFNMIGALSPEWVANTGNKGRNHDIQTKCQEQISRQQIQVWKKSLSDTINLLRNESTHLSSLLLQGSSVVGLDNLLQKLLQSYSESILSHFQLLMKEINRKINNYEKKVNNLASKLQNFLLVFRNNKLKKKLNPPFYLIKTERTPMADLTNRLL